MIFSSMSAHPGAGWDFVEEMDMQVQDDIQAGTEDFSSFISSGSYYVDKTRFLRPLLTRTGVVALFTRPRRFGKTLTMTMLRDFLKVDRENPGSTQLQERLFKGLEVMEDRELCARFMGQHPVLFITLKDVAGENFADAVGMLADSVSAIAQGMDFLMDSPRLSDANRHDLEILMSRQALKAEDDLVTLKSSLSLLSTMLFKHYGRQVAVLVDEYDVPLAKAQQNGYHKDMVNFYNGFMSLLKLQNWEQGNPIFKTVMTGCLRVAKNQIFTGANNFTPYTVVSRGTIFSKLFGFTPKETEDYLSAFGLSDYGKEVKAQYDGYLFDGDEIYNPWDVSKFVASAVEAREKAAQEGGEAEISTDNFWVGSESSGTLAIKSYLGTLADEETQKLQDVCDGKEVETDINDSMNYDSLSQHNAKDMWSLLLHTGYLTATRVVSGDRCVVRIPNLEIKECFDKSIMASFEETVSKDSANLAVLDALSSGEDSKAQILLQGMLSSFVSIRAFATRREPENYYEGFLTGLLASLGRHLQDLKVESDAGSGYADIQFRYRNGSCAMVIELKASGSVGELSSGVQKALSQIEEKQYASRYVEDPTIFKVTAAGIAFLGKSCLVATKTLKDRQAAF